MKKIFKSYKVCKKNILKIKVIFKYLKFYNLIYK